MAEYKRDFDEGVTPVEAPSNMTRDELVNHLRKVSKDNDGEVFQFNWNGMIITVDENTTVDDADRQYAEQQEAWHQSAEYKAIQAEQEKRHQEDQKTVDRIVAELPAAIKKGEEAVIAWLGDFASEAESMHVAIDGPAIANQLRHSGIETIEFGGDDIDDSDPDILARTIVTEAIDALENDEKPRANMITFNARRYAEIKKTGKDPMAAIRNAQRIFPRP